MIFVTVGTQMPFERLAMKMDEIAGRIDEEVVMQLGHTKYTPVHARHFRFLESDNDIKKLNREARVVVSHAGIGSILTALEQETPVLLVPRYKDLGETWDGHQLEIAAAIIKNKNVHVVYDINELEKYLMAGYRFIPQGGKQVLVDSLKAYLGSM